MKTIFFSLLLVFFAAGGFAQSAFSTSQGLNLASPDAPAEATWAAMEHDFGTIKKDEPVTHSFEVTNTGKQPLVIENVKPSCGCTIADFTEEAINPGETGYVKATYNAKSVGMFVKTVTVTTNTGDLPQVLRIKGEVVE